MRRLRNCITALLLGCCAPGLIWVGGGSVLYQSLKQRKLLKRAIPDLVCSLNVDCPTGFVCVSGHCVPAR